MTLAISAIFTPATQPQWLQDILANMATTQLQTTSWQSGGMARTILVIMSNIFAQEDAVVSGMAQGGFLDFAASGTVTYVDGDGATIVQPVTPDPSIPAQNPTGAAGWLDVLANSVYNVQRIGAAAASGLMVIANASANTYGPYAAGGYHVANPSTAATYANPSSLTIVPGTLCGTAITGASNGTPIQITTQTAHGRTTGDYVFIASVVGNLGANGFSQITVTSATQFTLNGSTGTGSWVSGGTVLLCQTATFLADVAGLVGSSGAKQISQAVTSNTGVSVSNVAPFFGAAFESNQALVVRCRAKLQSLSPGGPSGAYAYFALSAYAILLAQTPPVQMSAPITRVLKQASQLTGQVVVIVANAAGAVSGDVGAPVSGATNATPIVVTTSTPHGLPTGTTPCEVSGVLGNTAANGTWVANVTSGGSTYTLVGSAGNGAYTGGGSVESGDLGMVDTVIQANAVPDSVTEVTQTAAAWGVAVGATVIVPQAQVAAYTTAAGVALAFYFASLPIGGTQAGVLQYNDIIGVLYAAGVVNGAPSYVASIPALTLNGTSGNVNFPSTTSVAVMTPTLTVQGQ